jgi:hypothetical protein
VVTAAADSPDSALRKGGSEEVKITKERLSGECYIFYDGAEWGAARGCARQVNHTVKHGGGNFKNHDGGSG